MLCRALLGEDRKHVAWAEMVRLVPGCLVGIAVGLYVFTLLTSETLAKWLGVAVLPSLPYGITPYFGAYPGSPTVSPETYGALLTEILDIIHGSSAAASDRSSPPVEELSPGELRVLRYLPTNLARVEIATELSLSRNTVSTHIKSIYAKLGVSDRSSAVRRARGLGLLSAGRTR